MPEKMAKLLADTARYLVEYLNRILPTISGDWWKELVLGNLSVQQQRRAEIGKSTSLSQLDLASLLRVFDQNWYRISAKTDFSFDFRHFVKEMQTVRNRWAHAGSEGFSEDDIYRDLDTLQRFAAGVGASEEMIGQIKELKNITRDNGPMAPTSSSQGNSNGDIINATKFGVGQIVFVKSDPTHRGAIVSVKKGEPEDRYLVFINGKTEIYYTSQIETEGEQEAGFQFLPLEQFQTRLTALQICHPSLSVLYSLHAARIDFIPYQFRPVLKFIRSDRPRLLIADGVGVGKTIEAGLILRELQARRDIRSVLIICPKPLVIERKWQIEMKRFEEHFTHLDGKTLRFCLHELELEGVWPTQYEKAIIPYSLFDEELLYGAPTGSSRGRHKGLLTFDSPPRFDLVIVDEAHHIRNPETYSHRAVKFFCDNAEAVLFLTATPIQMGNDDLFVLLNVLRPDLIIDRESFEHMAAPNIHINRAISLARAANPGWQKQSWVSLREAANTAWGKAIYQGNPSFQRISGMLQGDEVSPEGRVDIMDSMEQLHTFQSVINRTRRRDIGQFTIRRSETVAIDFTPSQKKLHDNLLNVQAEIMSRLHGDISVKFMMTTIRRQAASCLFGLVPLVRDILTRRIDELSWEEMDDNQTAPDYSAAGRIGEMIKGVLEDAENLDPHDPKVESLVKIIHDKQKLPNNKVMLFSSFRHTLSYIHKRLQSEGFRVGLVHGGTPDEERVNIRNKFQLHRENAEALDTLLFSEVGCEGLDYQFCDCIVNYDLPWNPMRIDQRIGRIDRNGQRSEKILIYNFITPGTVDAEIYERCLLRIGVFSSALGECEEILGQISRGIRDIAEDITLSERDRNEKLQQLADNMIRLIQEQQKLEEKQTELFGIRIPSEQFSKEVDRASSHWLAPNALKNLITHYLQEACGNDQEYILGEKQLKTLRLSQENRNKLLHDFQKIPRRHSPFYREWEVWLKGGNPHFPITFDTGCASEYPEATLITPIHPLVRQSAESLLPRKKIVTALESGEKSVCSGTYPFAIYQWQFHGIRDDLVLHPIVKELDLDSFLSTILEKGNPLVVDEPKNVLSPEVIEGLEAQHYTHWAEARAKHQAHTRETVRYRKESLMISHAASVSLLKEQLSQATDERIRRMRESQIVGSEADYARHNQDLDIAAERADITAQPVAFGILKIQGGDKNAE